MSDVAVTFGAKDEGLKAAFANTGKQAEGLGATFAKVLVPLAAIGGAFLAVSKMANDFKAAIDMGGRLNDLAARTGETAGNLLILERAFQNAGAGADAVGPAINKMQRFMVEASMRGGEQAATMERLGLSYDTLKGLTPTEQMQAFAKAISETEDPALRTTAAMQVLGRSGGELIPLFRAMGTELEVARNQLGSSPRIMNEFNQALDTIGDNMAAINAKPVEFALGVLTQFTPQLVEISTQLANINAAGVGEQLSIYAKKAAEFVTELFKVGPAINNIKLAFEAIVSGDIGGGLKLIFLTMRDTALNAINVISAAGMAALQTLKAILSSFFARESAFVKTGEAAFVLLGQILGREIQKAVLSAIPKIKLFDSAIEDLQANIAASAYDIQASQVRLGVQSGKAMAELGEQIAGIPQQFKENYEANIAKPLIEMRDKVAETADQAKRVEDHLAGAAENMKKMGFDETGLNAPLPTLPPIKAPRIPTQDEINVRPRGGGGGGGGGGRAEPKGPIPLTVPQRMREAQADERIAREEAAGRLRTADTLRKQQEERLEKNRRDNANKEFQKEKGLPGGAIRSLEDLAINLGASRLNPEELKKKMDEIEKDIDRRAKGQDGTDDNRAPGGGGPGGAEAEPPKSTLETLVEQIKDLVTLIEPKLPVAVLTT